MTVAPPPLFTFDDSYARDLEGLYVPWQPAGSPAPRLLALNTALAAELGLDAGALAAPEGVAVLAGNAVPAGATPLAQAYAGHQFGGYSPRLGDGRALLLGEVHDVHGRRRDLHVKGSGRTPFARGGDGKAAVGPMLREYVVGEAMHALGIPTTRALAVVATGEGVRRETRLPGAMLTRVAASHLRVGTFEYAARSGDPGLSQRLLAHAIARHHPEAAEAEVPALALLERVAEAQAALVARWMLVGFIHGVMNTDNMTISGETIDYGPCAFMDAFDPRTVFSSIDHAGRYAYGNQPQIAHWNLARLAEALLAPLSGEAEDAIPAANEILQAFPARFDAHWRTGMRAKLGLAGEPDGGVADGLGDDLLALAQDQRADMTSAFRALSAAARGDDAPAHAAFAPEPGAFDAWASRWRAALAAQGADAVATARALDAVNPVYVPRNHLVEEALAAATAGDLAPFETLVDAVTRPFEEREGLGRYAEPAPAAFAGAFRTFCGT
ncbi:protein adenylyltransferase SelO [Baekduia soli]|uniref:protein adenylyltransferase SelO n=1 Tax=Baekduia soli TaxID=496014 RepID=UPI001E470002|nr:YdiU family protein [Baekduia soli]